jgi:hypothetical protein
MTKNSAPHCQVLLASIDWVVIGTMNVPSEPAAETMPSVLLRRSSGTLRRCALE